MNEVILNENYSKALLSLSAKVPHHYNEALFSLLMYDKVWMPSQFNSKFNGLSNNSLLKKENLINIIPTPIFHEEEKILVNSIDQFQKGFFNGAIDIDEISDNQRFYKMSSDIYIDAIKPIVYPIFKEKYKKYDLNLESPISNLSDTFFSGALLERGFLNILKDLPILEDLFKTNIEEFIEGDVENNIGTLYDDELFKYISERGLSNQKNREKSYYANLVRNEHKKFWETELETQKSTFFFLIEYLKMKELLTFSSQKLIPVKLNLYPGHGETNFFQNSFPGQIDEDHYGIYKIILDEVKYIPTVDSVEDVLRMRMDTRVKDFREVVMYWSELIMAGDIKEMKLRKEIRKANEDLKSLSKFQIISGWTTYLSIPLIAMNSIASQVLGSAFTMIGGVYNFKADRLKKKHSWLLFGRNTN